MNTNTTTARHTNECIHTAARRAGFISRPENVNPNGAQYANNVPTYCTCDAGLDPKVLMIGAGVTVNLWSDRLAATIVEIKGKKIGIQQDFANRIDSNGHYSDLQEWKTTPNQSAPVEWYSIRKSGRIVSVGHPDARGEVTISLGGRHPYRDPSF